MEPYSADAAKRKERRFFRGVSYDPNVKVVAIFSLDGLPIASILPGGADETQMAAMAASFHCLAERIMIEIRKGEFEALYMRGTDGYIIVLVMSVAEMDFIIIFSTTKNVKMSSLSLDYLRLVAKEQLLSIFEAQLRI